VAGLEGTVKVCPTRSKAGPVMRSVLLAVFSVTDAPELAGPTHATIAAAQHAAANPLLVGPPPCITQ
jgi:hypothetical protein